VQLVPAAKVYRGIPALFSRMVPLLVEADFTVALAAPELVEADVPVLPVFDAGAVVPALVGEEDPQAARTTATAARAATTVPGCARPVSLGRRRRAGVASAGLFIEMLP
jgi:hypothetical protein